MGLDLKGQIFLRGRVMSPSDAGRSANGTGAATDDAGRAGDTLLRLTTPAFGDGISTLAGADRPGAREISNIVMAQDADMPEPGGASDYLWAWGQFLDHDLSLTEASHAPDAQTAPIPVPFGDPQFDPFFTGQAEISFTRVDAIEGTGVDSPRQYENSITAFIDGSQIYGSDDETVEMMRVEGGKLRMVDDMLETQGRDFMTGDVRAAENVALSSLHTLFTREHNYHVDQLAAADPSLTDDQLFNAARARVEAVMQAITYNEFLPRLLGADAIGAYEGYDPSANPGISVEFSTAVYRFGHSLLSSEIQRLNEDGTEHATGNLALREAFFNPAQLFASGIDPILRGLGQGRSQALDAHVIEDVRSFLFGPPGAGGLDLASLNIQRGRDLGLGSYNDIREGLGLARAESFADITTDADLAAKLEAAYGDIDLVDAWVGGLAEDAVNGGMLGETFSLVMVDQFIRLRDGDSFWSENRDFSAEELDALWSTTLSDVILRNTDITHLQGDVFEAYERIGGSDASEILKGDDGQDLIIGFDGNDRLYGRDGNDALFGDLGDDRLYGQAGDDALHGGDGRDNLWGHWGDDALYGDAGDDRLFSGAGDDLLEGGAGHDWLWGHSGDDALKGDAGNDWLFSGAGNDALEGGSGHDRLWGHWGDDVLKGDAGNDRLYGGFGNDALEGGTGNDMLRGFFGDDVLDGGAGNDRLIGSWGNDTLTGGAGADTFVFSRFGGGHDRVTDYEIGDILKFNSWWYRTETSEFSASGEADFTVNLSWASTVVFESVTAAEIDSIEDQFTGFYFG